MEIRNTIVIDKLTPDSVSIKIQRILYDGNQAHALGEPVRTAYMIDDSERLKNDVPEPYLSAVLNVWGIHAEEEKK